MENEKVKSINLTKNEAIVSAKIDTWACIPTQISFTVVELTPEEPLIKGLRLA